MHIKEAVGLFSNGSIRVINILSSIEIVFNQFESKLNLTLLLFWTSFIFHPKMKTQRSQVKITYYVVSDA
jgi:hypothetical protein